MREEERVWLGLLGEGLVGSFFRRVWLGFLQGGFDWPLNFFSFLPSSLGLG
jgi:hypothetical protein